MNKLSYLFLFLWSSFSSYGNGVKNSITKKVIIDSASISVRKFPSNFQKKYTDNSFIYEFKTPEKNAWDRFKEWLYELFKDLFQLADKNNSLNNIDIILKVLALLLILFVIYLIVKAILNKEGGWIFGKNSNQNISSYEKIEQNIHQADFKKLIAEAVANGDKRLATRFYYLWLLKKLSDAKVIDWHPEKTSTEYSYEITNSDLKEKFQYLSYLYNYIWYGEFEVTEDTFEKMKLAFDKAITKLM